MNIEHLSHWSGQLNREMYVNRYGHAGIPVVVFASSGGSHNEYYDFGMMLVHVLSKKDAYNSLLFQVWIVKAGYVIGKTHMIVLKCIVLMNVMLLKKLFHLSNTKLVGLIQ